MHMHMRAHIGMHMHMRTRLGMHMHMRAHLGVMNLLHLKDHHRPVPDCLLIAGFHLIAWFQQTALWSHLQTPRTFRCLPFVGWSSKILFGA